MNIWIIDHYSVPVKYYPLARNTNFAKHLMKEGHNVTIFAASTVHNSSINLIKDNEPYIELVDDGVKYVLIKCHQYSGNGIKRLMNMYEFARKLKPVCNQFNRPDAIISTSMTLFACKEGVRIAEAYNCKKVAQITDLWPESLIAYGLASKNHPLVVYFRRMEKWIYKHADKIIFSMEGAYDYIVEQNWENIIPREKVFYINNGIDLDQFYNNKVQYTIDDCDLNNDNLFKVVYTGSIRKVNNLDKLLNIAKLIKMDSIVFLIWGDGDQLEHLKERVEREHIKNVVFKGRVEKEYIPYITSNASLNIAHNEASPLFRFGISFNKIFDYLAAGKPILCDFPCEYNPVIMLNAGVAVNSGCEDDVAREIERIAKSKNCLEYSKNALEGVKQYDFNNLTKKLEHIIEQI